MAASPELLTMVASERLALVELLETLRPDEWSTRSLCADWTVQDVAAHLAWAPHLSVREAASGLVGARFSVNRMNARIAVGWSARGTSAILEQLRENAVHDARPFGVPPAAALSDAVLHGLDIRVPLGRHRQIPADVFVATADFHAGLRWPLTASVGGDVRRRIDGLQLVADDVEWSHGQGPEVRGSAEALLRMLTGRPVGPEELRGHGAAVLYPRLQGS